MASLTRKPLGWFKIAAQARKQFDEAELRRLGESLAEKQIQPVLARPDGTLIAGERRHRAATLVGIKELEVVITEEPLTESQVRILQLTENIHRAELADAEKWRACEELLKLNAGWTNKDLAQHLKLSEATITKYLSPSRCTDEVRAALEAGQVGITAAYEISRVAPDKQGEMLRLREAGASRDGLANHARKQRKPAKAQARAKRILCALPSGIRVTVSGPDLSLDEFIEALGEAQKEARKGREQKLDVKTWQRVMHDKNRGS